MILILSADSDPHARVVHHKLRARGLESVWFDPGQVPAEAEVAVRLAPDGRVRRLIRHREGVLDLERVTAVWHRRPSGPTPHPNLRKDVQAYVVDECDNLVVTLFDSLTCRTVPATRPVFRRAENKIAQLLHAAAVGLAIPETLVGNCPEDLLTFHAEVGPGIISKMPSGVASRRYGSGEFFRYTERVGPNDLAYASTLRHAPATFQAYIDKDVELRVTVVGDRVFAAEIHSQVSRQTRLDWRHYDHLSTPIRPHRLPEPVAEQCRAVVKRMGLCYGALDLIRTPAGEYVFIEINPNGQYLWIEDETKMPISDAICDLLAADEVHS